MKSLSISALSIILGSALAWDNTPSIPPFEHMTWQQGQGKLMIEFELFTDLLCDGCAMLHEEFN